MAAMIATVSATGSSRPRATGCPTSTVTRGGCCTAVISGTREARGQTRSVPHTPIGTTGAPVWAASRAVPVRPFRTGSKNSAPRGMVPWGSTMTTSPARSEAAALRIGSGDLVPRSTGMPPRARARRPTTGASKTSCLAKKRTGRPSRAATRPMAATSK